MIEYDIPQSIRSQYLQDKETHDTHCEDGYIVYINIFSRNVDEIRCPYCSRFNKDIYND
jgi:hypothetical protein